MYQLHFHLSDRPFASVANPEHYFPASSIEQAREVIALNIERASGTTMLVGAVGTGKSLLCQLTANQFSNELPVCTIESGQIRNAEELLQAVLHGLDLPHHGDLSELRITLSNHITGQSCLNGVLLIVDEAERLSVDLLEEIRVLTNLVKDGQPCVRLLLAGAESLEEKLGSPALESLNQRVVGRLYLDNFSQEETRDYVCARINAVAGDATSIFADDAFHTVYRATNGVPRLVNQLCDHTLLLASVASQNQIDGVKVEEAWADLHQLPMTNSAAATTPKATSEVVVEFGSLEDDDAAASSQNDSLASNAIASTPTGVQTVVDVMGDAPGSVEIHFGDDVEVVDNQNESIVINEDASTQIVFDDFDQESEVDQVSDADQGVCAFDEEPQNESDVDGQVDRHSPFADEPDSAVETDASEEQLEPEEGLAADENGTLDENVADAAPLEELTMEQVTNPFGEQFGSDAKISYSEIHPESEGETNSLADEELSQHEESGEHDDLESYDEAADTYGELESDEVVSQEADLDEEVVIQEFASPSQFAREDRDDVSSNYSDNLAEQLSAAQPALRMHDAPETDEAGQNSFVQESDTQDQEPDGFAPLSSYMRNDEDDVVNAEQEVEAANEDPAIVIAMQEDESVAEEQHAENEDVESEQAGSEQAKSELDETEEMREYELESASIEAESDSEDYAGEFDSTETTEYTRDEVVIGDTLDGIEHELEQAQHDQLEDEPADREAAAESFDPRADPVMPEEGVESMVGDMSASMNESLRMSESSGIVQAAASFQSQVAVADQPSDHVVEEVAAEPQIEAGSQTIEEVGSANEEQRAKPKKLFRTLFSKMRNN